MRIHFPVLVLVAMSIEAALGADLPAVIARTIWERERQQEKRLRLDARCAHDRTSPVTARSEPPIMVRHFAITCETSTVPFSAPQPRIPNT
jgi:hypothetical protein